mgnify:FL=1
MCRIWSAILFPMNAKKCKTLRRLLKEKGFDYKQTKYLQKKLVYSNGEHPHPPIFLDPKCGRAVYQKNKTLSGGL